VEGMYISHFPIIALVLVDAIVPRQTGNTPSFYPLQ
jgi:hypothetical protein